MNLDKYKKIINDALNNEVEDISLITNTSNIVFKVVKTDKEVLYAKFYMRNSSHIDHELELYNLVDNKYLKELVYSSSEHNMAIYKELKGKTIYELTDEEKKLYADKIVDSLIEFFSQVSKIETEGYGLLDEKMKGMNVDFKEFIISRQTDTSNNLKAYSYLNGIFKTIYDEYEDIIIGSNTLTPIDTNMQNIMVLNDGTIKFIDPGELISAPILMGYGDFVAHTYKTVLYDKLVSKLNLNSDEEKLLRIYAIFSSLNILSFLYKNGVKDLESVIPYGNKYTFSELITEHMEKLNLK